MFARSLTERVTQQTKTTVNGPLGQTESWTNVRDFFASVTQHGADQGTSWLKTRGKEGTVESYSILARRLDRDWTFAATRFLWTPSDGGSQIILEPLKNLMQPGRQSRGWVKILCQDITNSAGC